jgi:ribosome-associated translation inhibitor RaiA
MDATIDGNTLERVRRRVERLARFLDEGRFEAQAFVEVNKDVGSHHSGDVWHASLNLDTRGDRLHSDAMGDRPEKAANKAISELAAELRRYRTRERDTGRKANGMWKKMQRSLGIT